MVVVFVLVGLAVLVAFGALHWYAWRRLVRDTTRGPGLARRTGTVVIVTGPVLMFGALIAERTGAPFWLQRVLAWPGFLWMAFSLYLLLALVAAEFVRPLVRRLVEREAPAEVAVPQPERVPAGTAGTAATEPEPEVESAPEPKRPEPAGPPRAAAPSRRLFVSRVVGGAAAAAAVGTVGYGTYGVLRGPG